ncbi:purine nucleoside phosphorylase-like protein [Kalaharituber pfeilii]|nr:purine nucleoside phosphorylase-like protein [Kalaharituber pfeilii]
MAETTFTSLEIMMRIKQAEASIKAQLPSELLHPKYGIVCGSGLGGLAATLAPIPQVTINYADIPGFASSTVVGHVGKLVFGLLGETQTPAVLMVGRVHFYEGHSIEKVTFPIRVLHKLGVTTLIVTNAAGGLNPGYRVGDIVVLNDHINFPGFAGAHPLRGPNIEEIGTRFPALSDAYDLALRKKIHLTYRRLQGLVGGKRALHEGVYAFVSGPTFETRAECRFLRLVGADLVGMSTVPEIVVARHAGMRILAMSLVTNCAVLEPTPRGDALLVEDMPDDEELNKVIELGKANHEEVLESGREAANDMQHLMKMFIDDLEKAKSN